VNHVGPGTGGDRARGERENSSETGRRVHGRGKAGWIGRRSWSETGFRSGRTG